MLGEAHRGDAVDGHSQDGDEQMDECDPVCEERPEEERKKQFQLHLLSPQRTVTPQGKNRIIYLTCDRPCPRSAS